MFQKAQAILLYMPHHRAGEAAGGSSPHNTLPRHSHPQYLCSGRWKQNGCNSSPILSKSAFQFLGFTLQILFDPIAHSVTCWRTDIVSSRSAASFLTVKSIFNFFIGQFYVWLSLCAICLGDNNVILWQNCHRSMYLKNSFQIMGDFKPPYHIFMAHCDLPFCNP